MTREAEPFRPVERAQAVLPGRLALRVEGRQQARIGEMAGEIAQLRLVVGAAAGAHDHGGLAPAHAASPASACAAATIPSTPGIVAA